MTHPSSVGDLCAETPSKITNVREALRDRGSDVVRWGFVGPGGIARGVAADLRDHVPGGTLHAVASRSIERAQAFADAFGASRAYDSVDALLADPDVDAVYLATPHRQHHASALAAIEAGKPLLVEKAFTVTYAGSLEIVEAARARGVFVMEAMWTRVQPTVVRLRELIADGALGEVRSVRADLGLHRDFDPTHRLFDPAQGGGALLDLGVYPVSFAQMVLGGRARTVDVVGSRAPNGVDDEATVMMQFDTGHAVASCSLRTRLPGTAAVFGTEAWVEVPPRFHHPSSLVVHRRDGDGEAEPEVLTLPATGTGYAHELLEVQRCLAAGLTESPAMTLEDTLAVMEILDRSLVSLGISYDEAR